MRVKMIRLTDLHIAAQAASKCINLEFQGDINDAANLLKRIRDRGHTSVLEHVVFSFDIDGISRALLQELVRHRIASYSVQSTRWALKRILDSDVPVQEHLVSTGDFEVDTLNAATLGAVLALLRSRPTIRNDVLKYALPEAFRTSLVMTINARSLMNMFTLRTSSRALAEFRELMQKIKESMPSAVQELFDNIQPLES